MSEPGWGTIAWEFTQKFGWATSIGGVFLLLVFWRFDAIKRMLYEWGHGKTAEHEQNWGDAQDIINLYIKDNDRLRADNDHLRGQVESLISTVSSSERGNSKLRHTLNGVLTYANAVQAKARAGGILVDSFPIDALFELDDEYGDRLRAIMKDFE